MSQKKTAPYEPTVIIFLWSGDILSLLMDPECPSPSKQQIPSSQFQILKMPSCPPETKCFPSAVMSKVLSSLCDPQSDLMICPSNFYQYVIFLSEPTVKTWYYSVLRRACLKAVLSNMHRRRECFLRSHMMHDPSLLAETACELSLLTWMDQTLLLCSLSETSMIWVCLVILQMRIYPSAPPEMILYPSEVAMTAVHPWLCASLMTYRSLPDCGRKARILPSDQPEMILLPSCAKATEKHSRPGT